MLDLAGREFFKEMLLHLDGLRRHEELRGVLLGVVPSVLLGMQLQLSIMPHFNEIFGAFLLLAAEVQRQQQPHLRPQVPNPMPKCSVVLLVLSANVAYVDHAFRSLEKSIIRKESGVGILSGRSGLALPSELLHLRQPRHCDVQRAQEVVGLRLDLGLVVDLIEVGVEQVVGVVGLGAGRFGHEGALGLGLHECDWIGLDVLGLVLAAVRVHVVRVEVGAVDEAAVDWVRVASAVVLEGRLAEVSGEGAVGNPPCGLLELNKGSVTFSMSLDWSFCVISWSSSFSFSRFWP